METKEMQYRIDIVNKIIEAIANRGRKFFYYQGRIAQIFADGGHLFMKNEYNKIDMVISYRHCKPNSWHHGGTLWSLTQEFRLFIETGIKSNDTEGYNGLYSHHWGYKPEEMNEIIEIAKELGYL